MNWLEHSHEIVEALVICVWIAGIVLLVLGKKAGELDWAAFAILVLFTIGIAVDLFFVEGSLAGQQKIWARGWIGPRDQNGAITIGVIEDALGLTAVLCGSVLGAIFSLNRWAIRKEARPGRAMSGILISMAGVATAWLALTPWLSILGLTLTTLGGVVLLDSNPEPDLIARFGSERTWGFVLAFLGAAVLAGGRHALTLDQAFVLSSGDVPHVFDWIGGALLVAGLYLHCQPFPFLTWLARAPKVSSSASGLVGQVFPAIACFGLMIRFESELRSIGVFSVFEWVALASALLAAICGLAQPTWKTALPLWLSASLIFAFAALCLSGGPAALAILIGTALSATALALLGGVIEGGSVNGRAGWIKVLLFAALASGCGLFGFVGSGGLIRLMTEGAQDPAAATLLFLAFMTCNLLLWKTAFSLFWLIPNKGSRVGQASGREDKNAWIYLLSGWILIVLSLGFVWSGTLTGGALPGDPDRVMPSWMFEMFGARASGLGVSDSGVMGLAQGLYWSAILLPVPLSFWLFGRKQDLVIRFLASSPRLRSFLESGYWVDRLGSACERAVRRSGNFLEKWITDKISTEWIPTWTERAVRVPSRWIGDADRKVYLKEEQLVRRWTEVPAKALQLVQNGDVQWYLFFAIGSVVAILVHFLGYIP